ncbi:MAG TPA: pyridoxal-phosphate dependent enzyme [Polyangiaceae bacterium]
MRLAAPARNGAELWLKNDGLSHAVYGGNKVRKLERIFADLGEARPRLLTLGAAGSHHVLTTALFGKARGLRVAAVFVPQLRTPHVEATLRASLGQGVEAYAAGGYAGVPLAFARAFRPGDHVIPPGASNLAGALAYADAALELAAQVRAGDLPEPDLVVVAVGSGGTAAGLLAGLAQSGLRARVHGVLVLARPFVRRQIGRLASAAVRANGARVSAAELSARLELDSGAIGDGYGCATDEAERARAFARQEHNLELDLTYTAKAFARALALAAKPPAGVRTVLYWHTLSARPLEPLLDGAPSLDELQPSLRRLLVAPR